METWMGKILVLLAFATSCASGRGSRFSSRSIWRSNDEAEEVLPMGLTLGSTCRSTLECLLFIPHSQCDWNERKCVCRQYHVRTNDSMCLPASLLTYGCAVDEQCQIKVPNSECRRGLCQCQAKHISLRFDKCLPAAKVHDYCLNDQQCHLGGSYSFCKYIIPRVYGKCQCPLNYLVTNDRNCLPYLTSPCENDVDCEATTPNAYCKRETLPGGIAAMSNSRVCACRKGFVTSRNGIHCEAEKPKPPTKPLITGIEDDEDDDHDYDEDSISIGHRCASTESCQSRDPNSACIDGICDCVKKTPKCNAAYTGCKNDTFQCRNGQCISWYFVCDGHPNCPDGSDEHFCSTEDCPKEAFKCNDGTCLSRGTVCNGRWECPDGSDEARCYKGIPCDQDSFRCASGQCLPQYTFCNAVTDCLDGSDELEEVCDQGKQCPYNSFRCDNDRCRSTAILCSGVDGCGDNSDETGCEACFCEAP